MGANKVLFLSSFDFVKKNGKGKGYGYNLVEFFTTSDGSKHGVSKTLFSDNEIDVSKLTPGDVVECKFGEPVSLGGKAPLLSINRVEGSLFFEG